MKFIFKCPLTTFVHKMLKWFFIKFLLKLFTVWIHEIIDCVSLIVGHRKLLIENIVGRNYSTDIQREFCQLCETAGINFSHFSSRLFKRKKNLFTHDESIQMHRQLEETFIFSSREDWTQQNVKCKSSPLLLRTVVGAI